MNTRILGIAGVALTLVLLTLASAVVSSRSDEPPPAYVGSWGTAGQLGAPRAMDVDALGNLYVLDAAARVLDRVGRDGRFTTLLTFTFAPWDVAVDPAGFIYAVDPNSEAVFRYTMDGLSLGLWSRPHGSGPGQWYFPVGLGVDGHGYVWVADANLRRVQKYTATGGYVTGFAVGGSGESPRRIRFDSADNAYVLCSNGHVWKYDPSGRLLAQWGVIGTSTPSHPPGIAVAPAGRIFVSEPAAGQIWEYTSEGAPIVSWSTFGPDSLTASANCLAADAVGRLFAAGDLHGTIEVYGDAPTATSSTSWGSLKRRYR